MSLNFVSSITNNVQSKTPLGKSVFCSFFLSMIMYAVDKFLFIRNGYLHFCSSLGFSTVILKLSGTGWNENVIWVKQGFFQWYYKSDAMEMSPYGRRVGIAARRLASHFLSNTCNARRFPKSLRLFWIKPSAQNMLQAIAESQKY